RVMLIGTINVAGRTLFQGGENDEENEGTEGAFSPGPMSDLLGRLRFSGAAQEHFHPDPVYAGGQPAARDPIVQSAGHVTRLDGRDQPAGADKHLLAAVPGGELRSRGAGRG
ncbi:MAG: hypothetical protein O3A51_12325, partial [Verrucomicrobia bacterium]|nr:hypothetical protein [Verrucomicrobiota bacterium]